MYSIEQKKEIREEFWLKFKTYSNLLKLKNKKPGKWIMKDTGIKQLNLKFHFDEQIAYAGIEIESRNIDKRIILFDKLEKLKNILTSKTPHPLIWELDKNITQKDSSSLVYAMIKDVNIYDRNCWDKVFKFLYDVMDPIEDVFTEYVDYLKYDQ